MTENRVAKEGEASQGYVYPISDEGAALPHGTNEITSTFPVRFPVTYVSRIVGDVCCDLIDLFEEILYFGRRGSLMYDSDMRTLLKYLDEEDEGDLDDNMAHLNHKPLVLSLDEALNVLGPNVKSSFEKNVKALADPLTAKSGADATLKKQSDLLGVIETLDHSSASLTSIMRASDRGVVAEDVASLPKSQKVVGGLIDLTEANDLTGSNAVRKDIPALPMRYLEDAALATVKKAVKRKLEESNMEYGIVSEEKALILYEKMNNCKIVGTQVDTVGYFYEDGTYSTHSPLPLSHHNSLDVFPKHSQLPSPSSNMPSSSSLSLSSPSSSSSLSSYLFQLIGRADCLCEKFTSDGNSRLVIVEIKNRLKMGWRIPKADITQLLCYMVLLRVPHGELFETVSNEHQSNEMNRVWRLQIGSGDKSGATKTTSTGFDLNFQNEFESEIFPRLRSFAQFVHRYRCNEKLRLEWHLSNDKNKMDMIVDAVPHFKDEKFANFLKNREEEFCSSDVHNPCKASPLRINKEKDVHGGDFEDHAMQLAIIESLKKPFKRNGVHECVDVQSTSQNNKSSSERNGIDDEVVFLGKRNIYC